MNITNEQKDIFLTLDEQIAFLKKIIKSKKIDDYEKAVFKDIIKKLENQVK
jgi:hypothetical protein